MSPRCRPTERKAEGFRSSEHEGDTGPVETTFTYDEWCRLTGFNPETGQYDREPEDVPPVPVLTQHNPNRRDTKRAQREARQTSDESDDLGPADPVPIGLIGRYDYDDGDPDGWYIDNIYGDVG